MNPKIAFVGLAVIGILFATGIGVGVGTQDMKGFSLKDPPGWIKSMASLLSSDAATRTDSKDIREDTSEAKAEPFKSPIALGKIEKDTYPLKRSFTIAESSRSVRKLKLFTEGPNEVKVLFHPAPSEDPRQDQDQTFTLQPKASQTVTVLSKGGKLTLGVDENKAAQVRVE